MPAPQCRRCDAEIKNRVRAVPSLTRFAIHLKEEIINWQGQIAPKPEQLKPDFLVSFRPV
jgi:hypothetical protein